MADPLLTDDEWEAMALTGELAGALRRIIGTGPNAENDWAETAYGIHLLQHRIMAQAAARAYPDQFRLMGGSTGVSPMADLDWNSPHMDGSWVLSIRAHPDRPGKVSLRLPAPFVALVREQDAKLTAAEAENQRLREAIIECAAQGEGPVAEACRRILDGGESDG